MSTIREHAEKIRALMVELQNERGVYAQAVDAEWEAQYILDALNAAELISEYAGGSARAKSHWRYIPDPQAAS